MKVWRTGQLQSDCTQTWSRSAHSLETSIADPEITGTIVVYNVGYKNSLYLARTNNEQNSLNLFTYNVFLFVRNGDVEREPVG